MSDVFSLLIPHLMIVAAFFLAIILFTHIFRQQERPNTSIAWILAIILIPYVGVPAYLIFGGRKFRRRAKRKDMIYPKPEAKLLNSEKSDRNLSSLLTSYGLPPQRAGNQINLIDKSDEVYAELLRLIDRSESSIHLMTFILSTDRIGQQVSNLLAIKASQGVKVRLLVHGLGSFYARFSLLRKLARAGVEVEIFMRMLPFHRRWSANLRNHRKIAVFDGQTALVGGMNISQDYMGPDEKASRWIDTMTLVRGPIVTDLNNIFFHDWQFATGKEFLSPGSAVSEGLGQMDAQIIASGPDVQGDPLYDVLIAAIYGARNRIWIATPYFVPDYELVRALKLAARMGVDVRLMMPLRSNHFVADMARNRLLRDILKSGVTVYFETKQMLHAKHIVIDQNFSLAGSANIDMRSLYFNYEVALFSDSQGVVDITSDWMCALMSRCEQNILPPQNFIRRWTEDLCWLMTPIL